MDEWTGKQSVERTLRRPGKESNRVVLPANHTECWKIWKKNEHVTAALSFSSAEQNLLLQSPVLH